MIKKIVSGGQTGADQAALDAAIELGVQHGGWIPKGRKTETGPLPEKYNLKEMPTASYQARTEQNVIDSDGTLILSHGRLTGGSEYTRQMAIKHGRPCLYIDLSETNAFKAAQIISSWLEDHQVEVLNIAGPRSSKDPDIYRTTKSILKTVFLLGLPRGTTPEPVIHPLGKVPRTVDEAVDLLIEEIPLRDRAHIAAMKEHELLAIEFYLGLHIRNDFGLWSDNQALLESCRNLSGERDLHPDDAAVVIVKALWKRLKESHRLRIVK
jgi:hypothetical protein